MSKGCAKWWVPTEWAILYSYVYSSNYFFYFTNEEGEYEGSTWEYVKVV